MKLLLLLLAIISVWYGQSGWYHKRGVQAPVRFGLLTASLLITGLIVVVTELLSVTSSLAEIHLSWVWLGLASGGTIWAVKQRVSVRSFPLVRWSALSRMEMVWLLATALVFSLTLVTALVYPPNNNDSMTYHMGRIAHWMQQQSVRPFATHIERQLYQPPLSEWIILHVMALSGSDLFANTVQWVAGIGCCIELSLLSRMLGGNRTVQIATVFAAATIPMLVLQTSSTQNDVVVSYYLVAITICLLRYYQSRHTTDLLWAGLALGFAWLTKGTAYLFAVPLVAIWGMSELVRSPRHSLSKASVSLVGAGLLILGLALAINAGHYHRNLLVYGHPLTDAKEQSFYFNEVHSVRMLISNISRNIALHFGFPGLHWVAQRSVEQIHEWMHTSVLDKNTTYPGVQFDLPMLSNNEDNASNLVHTLWFATTAVWLFWIKKQPGRVPYRMLTWVVVGMFLLFCAYLKWQPWHSRLHLTLFLLTCPIGAYGLVSMSGRSARWLSWVVFASALCFALANPFRPLVTLVPLTQPVSFLNGRLANYYVNRRELRPYHQAITTFINRQKSDSLRVGMRIGMDDWDYIWTRELKSSVRLYHVQVRTPSRVVSQSPPVDYIISTQTFGDTLVYNGKVYERIFLKPERTPFIMPVVFQPKLALTEN